MPQVGQGNNRILLEGTKILKDEMKTGKSDSKIKYDRKYT